MDKWVMSELLESLVIEGNDKNYNNIMDQSLEGLPTIRSLNLIEEREAN